ncbi:type VII secretion integral membrane protein EccD [Prauserella marina]|uniref:Type VII secretion integral membrane protein EccD n=1 Tax=Prauserella marina TaxID=530584 RepID=A0A222VTS9_9PSEU|nr:type VII secretion integral membrane protein EccD [Prauserella marina]ASR37308.1 type VII secretion integral membrane protein EccD [Prauserella marina]PWV74839.1 type VII secretion integral membrane protein EccD [Prauserella marina]SDD39369.1 type VII secretion integral membrane protein EccD [Prauserella marina]
MTHALGVALTRVTVVTAKRSIDIALPEDVIAADLVPYLLQHVGEEAADTGERHGGWLLRRHGGAVIDSTKTLATQRVMDGEVLHLVAGQSEWPEVEYDDVVESIASGSRRYGRSWGGAATRRCSLAAAAIILLAGLGAALTFTSPWWAAGLALLGAAGVLLAAGVALARAVGDAEAGAVIAACATAYAFAGGWLVAGPEGLPFTEFGAAQLTLGSTAALVFGALGYVGVPAKARWFAAAILGGLWGVLGGLLGGTMTPDGAAAVVLTVSLVLLPAYPLLAIRLGRIPLPELPQRSSDLFNDAEQPPVANIYAAAARTDELLSGFLIAVSGAAVVCALVLTGEGSTTRILMVLAAALSLLLRARLFAVARQRVPLLLAGGFAGLLCVADRVIAAETNGTRMLLLFGILAVALLVVYGGLTYSKKTPSPYLGRIADIFDVISVLALVPFAFYITGFYTHVQELMAGIG